MKIASVSENKKVERRIAITPEMAKKYNFSVLDLRHDAFDRIYFVYGKL